MLSLAATRSSANWNSKPGNWDRLNTRAIYPSTNSWGIPDMPYTGKLPARLIAYNAKQALAKAEPGDAVHFFLDDYRFETVWSQPQRSLSRIAKVGMALSPDFSLWGQMPLVMQLWQVYRSRWCAMWMHSNGIAVIPTVSWSARETFPFAFAGIALKSTVAISTVGIGPDEEKAFARGVDELMYQVMPENIVVYGRPLGVLQDLPVTYYPYKFGDR
jgi:hypothetical protein